MPGCALQNWFYQFSYIGSYEKSNFGDDAGKAIYIGGPRDSQGESNERDQL